MKAASYAPVYAGLYPELAEIARKHGYAMAVHGSMARDADLICVPWTDEAEEPQAVVDDITSQFVIRTVGEPSVREHGRIIYTLTIAAPGCFIDLSFTPRIRSALLPSESAEKAGVVRWRDMSSAPKDGADIILAAVGQTHPDRVTVGHWTTDEECRVDIGDCGGDCHCREYEYVDPSWISWDGGFTDENPPTHWMPLPASPSPATGEA